MQAKKPLVPYQYLLLHDRDCPRFENLSRCISTSRVKGNLPFWWDQIRRKDHTHNKFFRRCYFHRLYTDDFPPDPCNYARFRSNWWKIAKSSQVACLCCFGNLCRRFTLFGHTRFLGKDLVWVWTLHIDRVDVSDMH